MINAGTVAAYLTLDTTAFDAGINSAVESIKGLSSGSLVIQSVAAEIKNQLAEMAEYMADSFTSRVNSVCSEFISMWNSIPTAMSNVVSSAASILSSMSEQVTSVFSRIQSALASTVSSVSSGLSSMVSSVTSSFGRIPTALSSAASSVSSGCSSIVRSVTSAFSRVPTALTSAASSVASAASTIVNRITSALSGLPNKAYNLMVQTGRGMVSGLASMQSSIYAKAQSIANTVISKIRSALGISSPSKVMREVGRFTVEGMALGMKDNETMLREQAAETASIAESAIQAATPETSSYTAIIGAPAAASAETSSGSAEEMNYMAESLEKCVRLLSEQTTALEIDGRSFGRLIREYS